MTFLQRILLSNCYKINYSTTAVIAKEKSSPKTRVKSDKSYEIKISKDLNKYYTDNGKANILPLFPEKLLKKKIKTPDTFYIADPTAAKTIAKFVTKNHKSDVPLIEVNPGPGFLTKELLKSDVQNIKLYEHTEHFFADLLVSDNETSCGRVTF